jgi:hypothetical protein
MCEPPAHPDDSIEQLQRAFGLRLGDVVPGEGHPQRGPRLARGGQGFLESGGLISFAAIDTFAQSKCDAGARPLDLVGEGPIVLGDDPHERLERTDELECDGVDLETHENSFDSVGVFGFRCRRVRQEGAKFVRV